MGRDPRRERIDASDRFMYDQSRDRLQKRGEHIENACIHGWIWCAGDALQMVDRCIHHSPTLLELYTVQCRILKHAGDPEGAAAAADKARSMDLADRSTQHLLCLVPAKKSLRIIQQA